MPPCPARADAVADFYSSKQVRILIGFGAGGYETVTRLMAEHFSKHIPGHPTIVPQNMPGAGSMKVANSVYNAKAIEHEMTVLAGLAARASL